MRDVVIDLGDVSPEGVAARPAPPRRPVPWRVLLGVATALLVAMTTGAAHRPPPPAPAIVDARLGDRLFVTADRMFVVDGSTAVPTAAVRERVVTAYALPSGELLSRTTVAVSGEIYGVVAAGSTLLVTYQVDEDGAEATVALAEGTNRARWRQAARLYAVDEDAGLVLLSTYRPQTGNVWSVAALADGTTRWSMRQPLQSMTITSDYSGRYPRHLISATAGGRLEVRDARTGAVTAAATVPMRANLTGEEIPVWPTDRLLLVGAPQGTTAYDLPTLAERWHSDADLSGSWVQNSCVVVICALGRAGGLTVLDPRTGAEKWSAEQWAYADQLGPHLVAGTFSATRGGQNTAVLDPATGQERGVFPGWQAVGPPAADGTVTGLREQLGDDTVWHARLDPDTFRVTAPVRVDRVSGDCQVAGLRRADEVMVCRTIDARIGIWRLT